jgi:hypothetical protein
VSHDEPDERPSERNRAAPSEPGVTRGTRRFDSIVVFVFTVAVSLASLPQRSGYPLADAVEYLRNAGRAECGLSMIQESVRPFFFSAFLVPIFRLARIFGSSDGREVVAVVTALMITIAGLAGVVTYRFVEKIAGAPAALGAALFLGANRVFQFWAPTVTTDVPCAACLGAAAAVALRAPSWRNALLLGSLLGVAALFKYQALLPGGLLVLGLPFLWRGSGKRGILKLLALAFVGFLLGVVVQSTLDWFGGRGFGATFVNYLRDNIGWVYGIRARPYLISIFGIETVDRWYTEIFGHAPNAALRQQIDKLDPGAALNQPYSYYFTNIGQFLTTFEVALFALGAAALAWRRPRAWWLPFLVLGGTVAALTLKATKEFRLCVLVTPYVFLFVGFGFSTAIGVIGRRFPRIATAVAILALAPNLIAILGGIPLQTRAARIPTIRPFLAYDARTPIAKETGGSTVVAPRGWRPWQIIPECNNPADFSGYERAARWLNQNAPAGARVSATWFWQFYFRLRPDLFLVEPEQQVDAFSKLNDEGRAAIRANLASLDYFASHLQALVLAPDLFDLVEREFEVVATFENPIYDETLKTVFLMKRRAQPSDASWWVRVYEGAEAERMVRESRPDRRMLFSEGEGNAKIPVVELLDCDFDPGQLAEGHVVARLTWRVPEGTVATGNDLHLQLSARNADGQVIPENTFDFAYRRVRADRFKPGNVIVQRVPMRPARELFDFATPRKPNETVSLDLFVQLVRSTPTGARFPEPEIGRFTRWRDPIRRDVRVGGSDFTR